MSGEHGQGDEGNKEENNEKNKVKVDKAGNAGAQLPEGQKNKAQNAPERQGQPRHTAEGHECGDIH